MKLIDPMHALRFVSFLVSLLPFFPDPRRRATSISPFDARHEAATTNHSTRSIHYIV